MLINYELFQKYPDENMKAINIANGVFHCSRIVCHKCMFADFKKDRCMREDDENLVELFNKLFNEAKNLEE